MGSSCEGELTIRFKSSKTLGFCHDCTKWHVVTYPKPPWRVLLFGWILWIKTNKLILAWQKKKRKANTDKTISNIIQIKKLKDFSQVNLSVIIQICISPWLLSKFMNHYFRLVITVLTCYTPSSVCKFSILF